MAMQLRYLVSCLLTSFLISLNFVHEVGGGIVYTYNHVNDHGQPAVQWNKISRDQEHEMTPCPPWKYHKYNNSWPAVCGANVYIQYYRLWGRLLNSSVHLQTCHCMSYMDNSDDDAVVMGACPYLCTDYIYLDIHTDINLNNLCNSDLQQNRQRQMCRHCEENHSPSPYSYQLKCAHCSHYKYNWLKYLVMAYLSLTIFFLVVILFGFSALSAPMNAFIFISQIVSSRQ